MLFFVWILIVAIRFYVCVLYFQYFFLRTDIFNKGMHKLIPIDHDPQIQGACIYFYIFSKTLQDRSANHMAGLKMTFQVSMRRWWGSLNFFLLVGKIRMSVSFAQGAAIYTYIHTHIYTHTCIYACVIVCLHLIFFFLIHTSKNIYIYISWNRSITKFFRTRNLVDW